MVEKFESLSGSYLFTMQWYNKLTNDWRVIFIWTDEGPVEVQITDYH